MITEHLVTENISEPSKADNLSELSEHVLEAWVVVSISAKSFLSDINKVLDEYLYNSQTYEQVENHQDETLSGFKSSRKFPESKLQLERLVSKLETPEIIEALDCIYRNDLSIQILENFLGNSLDYVLSKEITFFWTTLLLLGDVDTIDSRMTSNDTNSVGESLNENKYYSKDNRIIAPVDKSILPFHTCLVFGLVRLLWNIVFVLYGAASLVNIPVEEKIIFLNSCFSLNDEVFPNNLSESPLRRVIYSFMTKIRLLFIESIPPGLDSIFGKYIFGIITSLSEKMLNSDDFSIKNEINPLIMREILLRIMINNSFGDTKKRMEICKSRLEDLQHLYEHKASKVLSLNGSFPSNLDFETLELLINLIGSNIGEKYLDQTNSGFSNNNGVEGVQYNNVEDKDYCDKRKIQEILKVISQGPILDDLTTNVSEFSLETLSRIHTTLLDELIWLLFCSEEKGADYMYNGIKDITLMTRLGDLPILMRLIGLEHFWKQRVISMFKIHSVSTVLFLEGRKTEESNLRIYSKYVHEFMGPILMGLLDGGFCYIKAKDPKSLNQENIFKKNAIMADYQVDSKIREKEFEPVNCDLTFQIIFEEFYMEYNWSLKRRVVELITDFPASKSAILDLYITMNYLPSSDILKEVWYSEISREILNYVNGKLLHLHVETSMIVGFYVKSIIFLLLLDFPNEWMDKTLTRFGDALRQRGDTTQCIVSWMPLMLENCSPAMSDSEIIMPISCSDEGVYPQFSICNPNYRNECRGLFERSFDEIQDYSQSFQSPQIKLVLNWISHIYGSNLTLLYDYIFNLASKVIGSWQDVGFESHSVDEGGKGSIIDEYTWKIDERRFQKDESVYEMIKMTIDGRSGDNLLKGNFVGSKLNSKDEQQLLTNCSIILQDISGSISDNKEYISYREESRITDDSKPTVAVFTISRSYWSQSVINMEIREDTFPLASVIQDEIEEYRQFFEREHPGRTFNCYSGYGIGLVDLTAMDGTVKSNVTLNFLQISIYDYISSKRPEKNLDCSERGASKDGFLDSDKLISSNSILNWFTISPKATERSSVHIDKALLDKEEEVIITFMDLLNHFRLDEQTLRWSVENMLSKGIIQMTIKEEGLECFDIPQTFSNVKVRKEAGFEEQEQCQDTSTLNVDESFSSSRREGGLNSEVNDMTVMLDFNNILNRSKTSSFGGLNCQRSNSLKKSFTISSLMETPKRGFLEESEEISSERARREDKEKTCNGQYLTIEHKETDDYGIQEEECDEEDEDLNLNFPTGIITTTISFKGKDLLQDLRHQGGTSSFDGPSSSKLGENKPGSSVSGGNLPPMIGFSETYLEKYCYFTTPTVLDEENHGFDSSPGNARSSKEREHAKYDIIKECELLIRATLQLNGAMAPAVLFGRVRAAIAGQSEDKHLEQDSCGNHDSGTSPSSDTQHTLTWPQHVQAINNMVDRGEVYNKGGRLFLEK
ncbi:uncharacterized protein cubi_02422 [Cryptosporidium ubiquitum]|uniref:Cullin family profile domain-containing protein n=1 Tax=Cryptosporidium ubiquitum TaxID=857276 RepID=A0A1J4MG31_9CRYT|nr:uncharacterized protein cubi_02422 [Cryptosporidium ubiquitum]OII73190.1 hypothetical protein cubi_02422 [Cryptosporidium ubiquitum]